MTATPTRKDFDEAIGILDDYDAKVKQLKAQNEALQEQLTAAQDQIRALQEQLTAAKAQIRAVGAEQEQRDRANEEAFRERVDHAKECMRRAYRDAFDEEV